MAVPTNTIEVFDSTSLKESLEDVVRSISPSDTPLISSIGNQTLKQTTHEWNVDSLASVGANAQVEGDDYGIDSNTQSVKLNNICQISAKTVGVSGTLEAVDLAGRSSELAYQLIRAGKALKKDQEHAYVGLENAKASGSSGTARETASLGTFYGGNRPSGGAVANFSTNGSPSAVPAGTGATAISGGSNRTFTEALLTAGILKAYTEGGNPDVVMMSPSHKQTASGFTGNASKYKDVSDLKTVATVSVYESDFGTLTFTANRLQQANRVDILQLDTWAVGTLRPYMVKDLASNGDNEKKLMLIEHALLALSPNANYGIFNLTA